MEEPEAMIQDLAVNTTYLASVESDLYDLNEEIQGIAQGSSVDLNQRLVYQSFAEFFVFLLHLIRAALAAQKIYVHKSILRIATRCLVVGMPNATTLDSFQAVSS